MSFMEPVGDDFHNKKKLSSFPTQNMSPFVCVAIYVGQQALCPLGADTLSPCVQQYYSLMYIIIYVALQMLLSHSWEKRKKT